MVDRSLHDVYSKWEARNPWNNAGKSKTVNFKTYQSSIDKGKQAWKKQFGNVTAPVRRQNYRSKHSRNAAPLSSINYADVCQFKVFPTVIAEVGRFRPFMGRCCSCMPESQSELFEERYKDSGVQNVLYIEGSNRDLISRHFKTLAHMLRKRINHKIPDVTFSVLTNPRLSEAVAATAQEEIGDGNHGNKRKLDRLQKELKKSMKRKLNIMKAAISNRLLKFAAWMLHHVLGWFLDSLLVHKGQLEMVKKAAQRDVPVIYLPTHRSHLDYILITFLLVNNNIQAPYVAAGDNLRIPVFGSLLKGLGGYFIRRKLDRGGKKDLVYRALLHTYMEELLRQREHIEFFIEGGRSRSGKALYPKGGLLSVVVDCYNEGVFPDALLVPISISYDKLLDGNFNTEQLGQAKVFETFKGAVRAIWRVLKGHYGNVRIDFSQPFSLKEYLQVSNIYHHNSLLSSDSTTPASNDSQENLATPRGKTRNRRGSNNSLYGTDIVVDDMRLTIQSLAEHVVYNQVQSQTIMSSQMLAFLLLVKHRQGASWSSVVSSFDWLKVEILQRNRDLGFIGKTGDVVEHGCYMLQEVLRLQEKSSQDGAVTERHLAPSVKLPDVLQLCYYGNNVVSVFAAESIMATAMFCLVDCDLWVNQGYDTAVQLSKDAIFKESLYLCNLFKFEFILKPPCQQYDSLLTECLDRFITSEILTFEEEVSCYRDTKERAWSSGLAKSLSCVDDDSDEDIVYDTYYVMNRDNDISMEKYWFLKSVISPFIEGYFLSACHLTKLQSCDWKEAEFVSSVHAELIERANSGIAQYCESASLDTLKNAVRAFESLKVVDLYQDPTGVKMIGLNKKYRLEEKLDEFIVQLESYRS